MLELPASHQETLRDQATQMQAAGFRFFVNVHPGRSHGPYAEYAAAVALWRTLAKQGGTVSISATRLLRVAVGGREVDV